MPRPPAAREPLKAAALKLFVERGVAATGIREIARQAEVSEAALYRHWTNKDDLVASLFREHLAEVVRLLAEALGGEEPPPVRMRRAAHAAYRLYDEQPYVFRFVLLVQHELAPHLPADAPTPHAVIEDFARKVVAAGWSRTDPVILAGAMIGIFLEVAARAIYGHLREPLVDHADTVADLAVRLLDPQPA